MLITNFGTIPSQGGLTLPDWSYRKKITILANSIDADLANFPCTVILNSSNFDFSKAKSDGSDIRFTDKLFNHYKFEKVEYSNANQFAKFNVLLPSVSDLTDTEFYCYSPDTDILTEDGWMNIKDLVDNKIDTKIATLNPDTNTVEYHYPEHYLKRKQNGKMLHQGGKLIDYLVTPNHKVYAKPSWKTSGNGKLNTKGYSLIRADELPKNISYRRDFPYDNEDVEYMIFPKYKKDYYVQESTQFFYGGKYGVKKAHTSKVERDELSLPMDKWLRVFGIYLSEGSLRKDGSIVITQYKENNRKLIQNWIENLGYNCTITPEILLFSDIQINGYLRQFGLSHDKFIPKEIKNLSKRQLNILLEAMMMGDGSWHKNSLHNKGGAYYTVSKQLAEDFYEIALKSGYAVTMKYIRNRETAFSDGGIYQVNISLAQESMNPKPNGRIDRREWVDYDDYVYCVQVPNHIVYVRRNGKSAWNGNCFFGNPNAYNTSIEAWQDMTGKQLTYNGNVKLAPNVAKFGKALSLIASSRLSFSASTDFDFGTGDGTIDFWLRTTGVTGQLIDSRGGTSSTTGNNLYLITDGKLQWYIGNGGWTSLISNLAVNDGKLHHIELAKYNNTALMFIDGKLDNSVAQTGIGACTGFWIGGNPIISDSAICEIDEFRVSKGIARHTSNFIPPTEPYTVDQYTKLLLHFDSAPFTDKTGKTVTTYGDGKPIKTAYADGARGAYFDGSGDYFLVPASADWVLNADFDISVKFTPVARPDSIYSTIIGLVSGTGTGWADLGWALIHNADGTIAFQMSNNGASGINIVSPQALNNLTDYDINITRAGNLFTLRINGVTVASTTSTITALNNTTWSLKIGGGYSNLKYLNGYITGAIIKKGISKSSDFTPPTKYEIDQYTVFCTNFDTIYNQDYAMVQHMGDSLVDATGNGNNGTAAGTTVVSTDYGKVRQFDGVDDKITTALFTNTDNITLTVMATKVGTGGTDLLFYVGTTGTNGYGLYTNSLKFSLKATSTFADTTVNNTTTPQVVTLIRTSGTWTAIIDGVSYSVTNLSVTTPTGSTYFGGSTTDFYDGQLSNARYSTVSRSNAYTKAEQKAIKNTLLTITGA